MSKVVAITEVGAALNIESGVLVLRLGGRIARTFRLPELDQVVLFGPVEVSHAASMALLGQGVEVVYLTQNGSFRGRLVGASSRHVELRVAQYQRLADENFALPVARAIVAAKIRNQRHLLLRAQASLVDGEIASALGRLRFLAVNALSSRDREELLGVEGAAAAAYFGVFGRAIKNPLFAFWRRTRRPPRDPVNACLSFGYTLLGTLAESEVAAAGLDPLLGALHRPEYGRPSLALDLIEELRAPVVDAVTLRLVNRRQLVPEDFGPPGEALGHDQLEETGEKGEGVYLRHPGRKVFIAEFFRRLREETFHPVMEQTLPYREILRQQAYAFARVLKGDAEAYRPFEPR